MITVICPGGGCPFNIDIDETQIKSIERQPERGREYVRITMTDNHYWIVLNSIAELLTRS